MASEENGNQNDQVDLAALAQQSGENQNDKQTDNGQDNNLPVFTDNEQKAYDQGWRPKEDFEGNESKWKGADEYLHDGKWIEKFKVINQKLDNQERQFDERLSNANKLNDARRKAEIKTLQAEQRNAVDLADTDAFDAAQTKIERIEKQSQDEVVQSTTPNKDPAVADWETKNPWINDPTNEKTGIAQGIWNQFLSQNNTATSAQALAHVDSKLAKLFPSDNTNPRRNQPNTTETNQRRSRQSNKELSMSDLTNDELAGWNSFGKSIFKTEKAYLKTVKDVRN